MSFQSWFVDDGPEGVESAVVNKAVSIVSIVIGSLLGSCGSPDASSGSAQESQYEREMVEWIMTNSRKAGPGKLILRDGSCLDLAKIAAPWSVEADPTTAGRISNGVVLSADGAKAALRPHIVDGQLGGTDIFGEPRDGRLRIGVSGWSPPAPAWASYMVASPARINENIRNGDFRRIELWPGDSSGLEAYEGFGGRSFVDGRRLVQCRDYIGLNREGSNMVWCTAVNRREDFQIGFRFDSRDVSNLPAMLRNLEQAIEATRATC